MSTLAILVCAAAENAVAASSTTVKRVRRKFFMAGQESRFLGGSQHKMRRRSIGLVDKWIIGRMGTPIIQQSSSERPRPADAELELSVAAVERVGGDRNAIVQPQRAEVRDVQPDAEAEVVNGLRAEGIGSGVHGTNAIR